MKYNEIKEEVNRNAKIQYIKECWTGHREFEQATLSRITNYLFVLNSGALLASLAYVAAKPNTTGVNISIWLFSVGILLISLHATIDYYLCGRFFSLFRKDVDLFYKSEIDWEVLVDRNSQRGKNDWYLHLLGWLSGILFFAGLFNGICHIS
ncbi:MAG: hypothetical protein QME44_03860 [Thermodesulfobacteriota bacterium]|nr:hypothetical protein [Thermodesulfobacteriota bacterium]